LWKKRLRRGGGGIKGIGIRTKPRNSGEKRKSERGIKKREGFGE